MDQEEEQARLHRWLARAPEEEVLEPSLPIVDPVRRLSPCTSLSRPPILSVSTPAAPSQCGAREQHHHLWDLRDRDGGGGFAQKLYLTQEIVAELRESGHDVRQTIFMQCNAFHRANGPEELRPVGETEFAHGVAAMSASGAYGSTRICAGIVSTVDLGLGASRVRAALAAHMRASPNFRGIRAPLPPAEGLTANFDAAFAELGHLGLVYEQYAHDWEANLPVLVQLAERHPAVRIVINHLGGKLDWDEMPPGSAAFGRWRECLVAAAACPNIVMKCGGLTPPSRMPIHMSRRAQQAPVSSAELARLWLPYHEAAIRAFGPKRCMFESVSRATWPQNPTPSPAPPHPELPWRGLAGLASATLAGVPAEVVADWLRMRVRVFLLPPSRYCRPRQNFPVDKECVSYRSLWNAFKRIAERLRLSADDKAAIFHDTAAQVYRLQHAGAGAGRPQL
jgi:L-fuconolactonase